MANQKYKIELTALDKTKAAFNGLKKNLGGVGKLAGGAASAVLKVGIAATAAATAVSLVAKKSFDFADAIGKVSTRTGIATDTVQAFQIAAVESGSSVEIANKSLEKFTRSVGDAQRGLKTQADIFKDLGVEIEDATGNTKDMDTLLREVSDGMAGLQSQSEKATVAANLFGRAGIQVVDVLDNGGAAFDAYIEKAKAYGLILSEQGIRQSEKFNDTLSFITRQIQTATAAVSIAFLPILQNLATSFKEVTASTVAGEDGVMKFGESIRDIVLQNVDGFIRGFADFLDTVHKIRRDLVQFAVDVKTTFYETELATLRFRKSMDFLGLGTDRFNALIGIAESKLAMLGNEMTIFDSTTSSAGDNVRKFADNLKTYFVDVLGKSNEEANNLLDAYNALFTAPERDVTDIGSPLEAFKQQFVDINKLIETNTVNAIKKMEDALVDFVTTGKANFKDLVRSIIADLARVQIRKGLTGMFGDFFGIEGRATGGAVAAGQPYMVGERGAELFVPNQSGTIIPNNKLAGAGGITINQSVNFATGVQDTVKNEVLQLLPEIAETSKGAVLEAMNRGGNFRRGMR